MKASFSIIIVFLFFISCASLKKTGADITGVQVKRVMPMTSSDSGIINYILDSCEIYRYRELVLYHIPYNFTQYKIGKESGDTTTLEVDFVKVQYRDFVFKEGDSSGLMYDALKGYKPAVVRTDSITIPRSYKAITVYNPKTDSLVSRLQINGSSFKETYITKLAPDPLNPDTIFLYFSSKTRKADFEFNELYFDRSRKNKLFKVDFIFNPATVKSEEKSILVPRRIMTFESKQIEVKNKEAILALFSKFESEKLFINW